MSAKWSLTICLLFTATFSYGQSINAYTEILTPYQRLDTNKKLTGFSTEIVKKLAQITQDDIHIQALPWERSYRKVLNEKNALIFSIYRAPFREELFHWVAKLDDNIHYFYALRDHKKAHASNEAEAKKLTTAVIENAFEDKQLSKRGYNNLAKVSSTKQVVNMLYSKRIDLLFGSEVTIANLVTDANKSPDDLIRLFAITKWGDGLYIAFNKDSDKKIITKYQAAFDQIMTDGTFDKIKQKHFRFNFIKP